MLEVVNVSLPSGLKRKVEKLIQAGLYSSVDEVLADALRHLPEVKTESIRHALPNAAPSYIAKLVVEHE